MTPIRYHEAAEAELLDELGYLELRAEGLGQRFFAEVLRAESMIAQLPDVGEEIRAGIRKCMVRTFRHSLIYAIESDSLLILGRGAPEPTARLPDRSCPQWRTLGDRWRLPKIESAFSISTPI